MDHFDHVAKMNQRSNWINLDLCIRDKQYTLCFLFFSALICGEDLCDVTSQNIFHMLVMSLVVNCDGYIRLKLRDRKALV